MHIRHLFWGLILVSFSTFGVVGSDQVVSADASPVVRSTHPQHTFVGSSDSDPPTSSDVLTEDEKALLVEPLPFDERLGQIVGIEMPTIHALLADRQSDVTIDCLADRGHDVGPAAIAALVQDPPAQEAPTYGGGVQRATEFWSTRNEFEEAGLLDADFQVALDTCTGEAIEEIGNPLAEYQEWNGQVTADLSSTIRADRRYVEARDEEDECLESLGLAQNPDQLVYDLSRRADDAYQRHADGALSQEELDAEIAELQREEDVLARQLDACVLPRLVVEGRLMTELQDEFLEEHAATIAEFGEDVRDALEELGIVDES